MYLRIKEYRLLRGLTQKELARKLGISRSYLSEIENGKYDIPSSLFIKFGKVLKVSLDDLAKDDCIFCKTDAYTRNNRY